MMAGYKDCLFVSYSLHTKIEVIRSNKCALGIDKMLVDEIESQIKKNYESIKTNTK